MPECFSAFLHQDALAFRCACGAPAHVESICSGTGIGALYQGVSPTSPEYDPFLDGAEVSRRAQLGEKKAIEALRASGHALGQACGSWANILDPEAILLTGTVCNAGQMWFDAVMEGFAQQALVPLRDIPFIEARLGGEAPLVGAAENLLDQLDGAGR